MALFDTHVHFDSLGELGNVRLCIDRANRAGVSMFVAVGGSPEANAFAVKCADLFPGTVLACVGYDRHRAGQGDPLDTLESLVSGSGRVVAVGETGLDYHHDPGSASQQRELFEGMLRLAAARRLPVVVHSRDAEDDTVAMLGAHVRASAPGARRAGVVHCFTGNRAFAAKLLDLGFDISFSGILTFRNASAIREAAAYVPDDRFVLETDTPYLAPEPCRGRTNEPALLVHTARILAEVRGVPVETVILQSTASAERLFGVSGHAKGAGGDGRADAGD